LGAEQSRPPAKKSIQLSSGQRLQWNYLKGLTKEFNNRENSDAREHAARSYLQGSRGLKELFEHELEFWQGRGRAALILRDKVAGAEAGDRLAALAKPGAEMDPVLRQLTEQGWTKGGAQRPIDVDFVLVGLGIEMAHLAPGSFDRPRARQLVEPPTEPSSSRVTLTQAFWIGRHEITARQWKIVMRDDQTDVEEFRGNVPVVNVSWEAAMEFCRKLTTFEQSRGTLPRGFVYSLPTEAQWEYACRANKGEISSEQIDQYAWHLQNSGGRPHVIAGKQPNAWGLHGMLGNVSEWCLDWFEESLPKGEVIDPTGPAEGELRVVRGGNFNSLPQQCTPGQRSGVNPEPLKGQGDKIGFRVVLTPVGK
jgi:formylglycine-generating enzyme required for sulfatase activity